VRTTRSLCRSLFDKKAPAKVDVSLRVSSGAYGEALMVLRVSGQGEDKSEAARTFVTKAINDARSRVLWSRKIDGAGSAAAAWVGTGPGRANDGDRYREIVWEAPWATDKTPFVDAVDTLVRQGGWVDLHLGSAAGSVVRRVLAPSAVAIPPALFPPLAEAASALESVAAAPWLLEAVAGPDVAAPLDLESAIPPSPIPDFRGEVFERAADDAGYQHAIEQYAVSSYDEATVARRMTPRLVAYAVDAKDVQHAVKYAVDNGLRVVARSGGHQYCGMSSGGDDTLLVDVGLLEQIAFDPQSPRVAVGPGVALRDLTRALRDHEVSIPHGECPLVNLGGHVQSGGVGHQLRSLGLTLDWVCALKLVTCDAAGNCAEQTFTRPLAGDTTPAADVFRAVLGGGPGSWGVLTEITFDLATDAGHLGAIGRSRTYPYDRSGWSAALAQMRIWSAREASGALPAGLDLFLSVVSGDLALSPHAVLRPAVLLVETTSLLPANDPEIQSVVAAVAANVSFIDKLTGVALNLATGNPDGPTPLSRIVDHGVRATSALGGMPGGREFDLPYKKSLYITRDPLPIEFCSRFEDLVDRVDRHPGTKVVFQGVVGGGRFQENGSKGTTRMQHRDALVQIVFDVFYEDGFEHIAEGFQAEMRSLWLETFPEEIGRMFWGTFEDPGTNGTQLDMSVPGTQARYYDSAAAYAVLQRTKRAVDPRNVFRTSFTVQP
jgi:FAD/FMN-containing dehydrogenase